MPYTPNPTWQDGSGGGTPITASTLNHIETGLQSAASVADAAIPKPSSPSTNNALVWSGSSWVAANIVNANIDAAAAIAYSKLNLAGSIVNNDIANAAAIAASKLAGYPNDATKTLAGDGTWSTRYTGPTIYRKTTAKTVNTTVSATDLLNGEITVAANAIGSTGLLRLTAIGDWLNNSGGSVAPPRLQVKLGATTLFDTNAGGVAIASAQRYGWRLVVEVMNLGATNSQAANFFLASASPQNTAGGTLFTTGEGVYSESGSATNAFITAEGFNSSAVDTTTSNALVLNVINGSGSASYETKLFCAVVEIV